MADEMQDGHKNRETWAFDLHWSNDQELYKETLEVAREAMDDISDWELGNTIIQHWAEVIETYEEQTGEPLPEKLRNMRDEVGSWWRIDRSQAGASVRESLDNEA